jgi:hypothetical protein
MGRKLKCERRCAAIRGGEVCEACLTVLPKTCAQCGQPREKGKSLCAACKRENNNARKRFYNNRTNERRCASVRPPAICERCGLPWRPQKYAGLCPECRIQKRREYNKAYSKAYNEGRKEAQKNMPKKAVGRPTTKENRTCVQEYPYALVAIPEANYTDMLKPGTMLADIHSVPEGAIVRRRADGKLLQVRSGAGGELSSKYTPEESRALRG